MDDSDIDKRVLVPFLIKTADYFHLPIGDAIMALPIARELGTEIFLPKTFSGDLIAELTDTPIVREIVDWKNADLRINDIYKDRDLLKSWALGELKDERGPLNVTGHIARGLDLELTNPVPALRRTRQACASRILIFPNGSVPSRSFHPILTAVLSEFLKSMGYDVELATRNFENPLEFADFVASAEYVIAPYTGPMHLAAAMGVKTVAICVGDSRWVYRPLQENVRVLDSDCHRCWDERAGAPVCAEEFTYCQRAHSLEEVLTAMRELD